MSSAGCTECILNIELSLKMVRLKVNIIAENDSSYFFYIAFHFCTLNYDYVLFRDIF